MKYLHEETIIDESNVTIINPTEPIIIDSRRKKIGCITIIDPEITGAETGINILGEQVSGLYIQGGQIYSCLTGISGHAWRGSIQNIEIDKCQIGLDLKGWGWDINPNVCSCEIGLNLPSASKVTGHYQLNNIDIQGKGISNVTINNPYIEDKQEDQYSYKLMDCYGLHIVTALTGRKFQVVNCTDCFFHFIPRFDPGKEENFDENMWRFRNEVPLFFSKCTDIEVKWPRYAPRRISNCTFINDNTSRFVNGTIEGQWNEVLIYINNKSDSWRKVVVETTHTIGRFTFYPCPGFAIYPVRIEGACKITIHSEDKDVRIVDVKMSGKKSFDAASFDAAWFDAVWTEVSIINGAKP